MTTKRIAIALYLLVSAPVLAIVAINSQARFVALETAAHWKSKAIRPVIVACGDSITAGGREWGWRVLHRPLSSINLAGNGYTVAQTIPQVMKALTYQPRYILIGAGTNDLVYGRTTEQTAEDYRRLLELFHSTSTIPVVTLIPFKRDPALTAPTHALNQKIRELAEAHRALIVDLNPTIAPQGTLLPEYTSDGSHFNEKAYDVWAQAVRDALTADR